MRGYPGSIIQIGLHGFADPSLLRELLTIHITKTRSPRKGEGGLFEMGEMTLMDGGTDAKKGS